MSIIPALSAMVEGFTQGREQATDRAWKKAETQHLQQINQAYQRNASSVPPPAHTKNFMDAVRQYAQTGDPNAFAGILPTQLQAGQQMIQSAHDQYVQTHHQQHAQFIQSFTSTSSVPPPANIPRLQNANALRPDVPPPAGSMYASQVPPSLPPAGSNDQYSVSAVPPAIQGNIPSPRFRNI